MSGILRCFELPVIAALGWTLVHLVWQGAIVAALAVLVQLALRRVSAHVRYLVLCAMLGLLVACPMVTWWSIAMTTPSAANEVAAVDASSSETEPLVPELPALPLREADGADVNGGPSVPLVAPAIIDRAVILPDDRPAPTQFPVVASGPSRMELAQRLIEPALPWLVAAWLLGVWLLSVRLLVGWRIVQRLRRLADVPAADVWQVRLKALATCLRVAVPVRLMESALVEVPTVIGWFRPLIVLPASVLTGLTPPQLEALLAHELAHIRRHDYLVNLVQTAIETLLFYHPAVWWLSRCIRDERELCCDDLAVEVCGSPLTFAQALTSMEELRSQAGQRHPLALTLAADGGSLLARVRRLAIGNSVDHRRLPFWGASLFTLASVAALGVAVFVAAHVNNNAAAQPDLQRDREASESPVEATPKVDIGEWPMWGGSPSRNHVAKCRMPVEWDLATGKNIVWKTKLGTATYSSPVVSGGKVFIGTNNGAALDPRRPAAQDLSCLVCFDEKTGELLWQYASEKLPAGRNHDWPFIGLCSTPCVIGDRVWVVTNRCEVICLDTNGFRDGENDGPYIDEVAKTDLDADIVWKIDMFGSLGVRPLHQSVSSVAVSDGVVLLNTSNGPDESGRKVPAPNAPNFLAVDAKTGRVIWQDNSAGDSIAVGGLPCSRSGTSPAVATIGGVKQAIFAGREGWLYGFDFADLKQGKTTRLWQFDCNPKTSVFFPRGGRSARNTLVASPVVVGNRVFIATGRDPEEGDGPGDLWCIDATKRGDISGELVFNKAHQNGETPIPHKALCACDPEQGDFTRPNPNSGAVWHYTGTDRNRDGKLAFDETFHRSVSSPTIHMGLVFIPDFSGLLHCVDASAGHALWTHDLWAGCRSSCVIADGHVLIGDEDGDVEIFKVPTQNESAADRSLHSFGAPIYSTPALANHTLYLATSNEIIAIRADDDAAARRANQRTRDQAQGEKFRAAGQAAFVRADYQAMELAYESLVMQELATPEDALWLGHAQHLQGHVKDASASYQLLLDLADTRIIALQQQTGATPEQMPSEDGRDFGGPVRNWKLERDRELERLADVWPQWVLLAGQVQLFDLGDAAGAAKTLARGLRFVPEADSLENLLKDAQTAIATKSQPFSEQIRWRTWLYPMATQRSLAMAYEKLGDHEAAARCWCRFQLSSLAYRVGMADARAAIVEAAIAKVSPEKREPFHDFVLQHPGRKSAGPRDYDIPKRLKTDANNPFEVRSRLDGFTMLSAGPAQPSVVKLKSGSWLMAFTSGDSFQSRVMFSRSDDGHTWSKPYDFSHNGVFPTRSPTMIEDDEGTLWLLCSSQRLDPNRYSSGGYQWWVCSSEDGRNWSTLKPLSQNDGRPFAGQYQHTAQLTRDRTGKFWIFCNEFAGSTARLSKLPVMQPLNLGLDKNEHITGSFAAFDADNRCLLALNTLPELTLTTSGDMTTWAPRQIVQHREENRSIDRPRLVVEGNRFVLFYQAGWGAFRSGHIDSPADGSPAKIKLSKPVSLNLVVGGSLVTRDGDDVLLVANEGYENSPPVLLAAKRETLLAMEVTEGTLGTRPRTPQPAEAEKEMDAPQPQGKESKSLYKKWQSAARANGNIPGGTLGPLARVMTNFIKNNPTDERSPKFAELLKRIDTSHDWTPAEAVKLLDEVSAIYDNLPQWVEDEDRFTIRSEIQAGQTLPAELENAPWGDAQPNGLRTAWLLEPRAEQYPIGSRLKSRLLIHNSGKNTVVFVANSFNQAGGKALAADGTEINVSGTYWTTIGQMTIFRLAPGQFCEVFAPGIGIGTSDKDIEDWTNIRIGAWIQAKPGDEVTFTPAPLSANGVRGGGGQEGDPAWWLKFIKARVSLDAPVPADAAERETILRRIVTDLFGADGVGLGIGVGPTDAEIASFVSDGEPGALDRLAQRLSDRPGFSPFTGALQGAVTKFRVVGAEPDAATKPRVATGPGNRTLGEGVRLVIVQKPVDDRRVNEAKIVFPAPEPKAAQPHKPYDITLPDGNSTWAIAWQPGTRELWVRQQGMLRKIDFANPAAIQETRFEPETETSAPQHIRDALGAAFGAGEVKRREPPKLPPGAQADEPGADKLVFVSRDTKRPFPTFDVADGVTLNINAHVFHGADVITTARLRWPAREGQPALGHDESIAMDAFGNRERWAFGWFRGTKTFWYLTVQQDGHQSLRRVSFADPQNIKSEYQRFYPGEYSLEALGIPPALQGKFMDFLSIQKWTIVDKTNGLPEISGESRHAARPVNADGTLPNLSVSNPLPDRRWKINFVDAATGQPVPRLRATVISRTTDGTRTTFVTRVVNDGTFERNLGGDEYAWVSVEDHSLTGIGEKDRYFGNVPDTVNAAVKFIDPDSPFVVRVAPRAKPAGDEAQPPAAAPGQSNDQTRIPRAAPARGLEFLKPYPQLHELSLEMTEKQFLELAKKHSFRPLRAEDVQLRKYEIDTGDGHIVIVMFGNSDGTCSGIQRIRGQLDPLARFGDKLVVSWVHAGDHRTMASDGFRLAVLNDGTVIAAGDGNRNRECQIKLTREQLDGFLRDLDEEENCFQLAADGRYFIKPGQPYNRWDLSADWIHIKRGAQAVHLACIYGWESGTENSIPGAVSFGKIRNRLQRMISITRASGWDEIERLLPIVNAALKTAFPARPPLTRDDFTSSERYLYPARSMYFRHVDAEGDYGVELECRDEGQVLPLRAWSGNEKHDIEQPPVVRGFDLS